MVRTQDLATRIMTTTNTALQQTLFQKFDKLDKERVGYTLAAETHTSRPPPNDIYQWSPWLERIRLQVNFWKLRMNLRLLD